MLVTAAAQTWGVAENTLTTEKGEVVHQASGRRLKYGALVDKAAALPVPKAVALKDPKDFKLLGQSLPRLDIPEKVNGTAEFGLDVKRPGMLIARVVRCPVFGGKVASFNADKAKAVPGVRHVVQISNGIAVVADNYWAASQGRAGARGQVGRRPARDAEQRRHHQEIRASSRSSPARSRATTATPTRR